MNCGALPKWSLFYCNRLLQPDTQAALPKINPFCVDLAMNFAMASSGRDWVIDEILQLEQVMMN